MYRILVSFSLSFSCITPLSFGSHCSCGEFWCHHDSRSLVMIFFFLCRSVRLFFSLGVMKFVSVNKYDFSSLIFSFFYPAFFYILRIASWLMTLQSKMKLWPFWPSSFWTKLHLPLLARWRLRDTLWLSHHRQRSKFYVFIPFIVGKNNALTIP